MSKDPPSSGLIQLYPPEGAPATATDFDIVAIHGLEGHPLGTWTSSENNKTMWIRDFLKDSFPRARIFTFGYSSQMWFSKSMSTVDDVAKVLLSRLRHKRARYQPERPIIFICHSLGGIVLKTALVIANEKLDKDRLILQAPTGVMFMGTPHRGAELATVLDLLVRLPGMVIRKEHVKLLKSHSTELEKLCESFGGRARELRSVVCFYETEASAHGKKVVTKPSATIDNERSVGIAADHRMMCRFDSPGDANYELVLGELEDMVEEVCAGMSFSTPGVQDRFGVHTTQRPTPFDQGSASVYPSSMATPLPAPALVSQRSFQSLSTENSSINRHLRQSHSSSSLPTLHLQTTFVRPGSSTHRTYRSLRALPPAEDPSLEISRAEQFYAANDFWHASEYYNRARSLLEGSSTSLPALFSVYIRLAKCCIQMFVMESCIPLHRQNHEKQKGQLQLANRFLRQGEGIAASQVDMCWVQITRLTIQMLETEFNNPNRQLEVGPASFLRADFDVVKNELLTLQRSGVQVDELILQINGVVNAKLGSN